MVARYFVFRPRPLLREARQLAQLALHPRQLRSHDRDVDEDQDHEDDVGAGDVLAGLVKRQRGSIGKQDHGFGLVATPGAMRPPAGPLSRSSALRRRESCAFVFLAVISNFTSVSQSSPIAVSVAR